MNIEEVQSRTWANKVAKGFVSDDSPHNVPYEFALAYGELAEAFDAWRKNPEKVGDELADTLIYLTGIATMCGVDLAEAVAEKLAVNESRTYVRNAHGSLVKSTRNETEG